MKHGNIDERTAKGLKVLRRRIERAGIPASKLDESLNLATWNIREFGRHRRRTASLHFIAEIIGQFDLVAIVELRDNLNDLSRVLDILGPYWRAVFSDFNTDRAGNRERIGYVYDRRAVTFSGLAAEPDPPRRKSGRDYLPTLTWWRSPFVASFRAGNFDFILITAHIRWGSGADARVAPLRMLADWIKKRRGERYVFDKDIIVMGDFNIPDRRDPTFRAVTSRGLRIPRALLRTDFGSNLEKNKRYDQILHYPRYRKLFTDSGGVLDFYASDHRSLFPGTPMTKPQFTYQLSDHLPLWIQLDTWQDDIVLEQILNR